MSPMPDEPKPNPFDDLPIEIDTLTALIEGDLAGPEAHEVRERLLAADPELAQRIELMAQDRVVLRTLGDEQPPEGLSDAIIAQLEREALLGLQTGTPGTASLPVSRIGKPRQHRRWLQRPAGAGLAAAALLVLAFGVMLQLMPASPSPTPTDDNSIAEAEVLPLPEAHAPTAIAADVPSLPIDAASRIIEQEPDAAPAGIELAAAPATVEIFSDDWDRAVALLDEGRLLIRVRSASPAETLARLEPLGARAARAGEAWRLENDVTEPLAMAMQAKFAPQAVDSSPLILANEDTGSTRLVDPSVQEKRSTLEGVYMVDARRDRAAIASLSAALSLGDGQVAVFEELAEPLDLPSVHTPDAVLWWSRPASSWGERRHVPVVIERVDR